MNNIMPFLLSDGYKQVHAEQFPKGLTKLVSYMTPRKSRLETQDKMIFFGLQAFCKKYLIDYFDTEFFHKSIEDNIREYTRVLDIMIGKGNYSTRKIEDLWRLGYLPIEIKALPEGTQVPMHVPCLEISNTHKDFAWVVQWIESLLSSEIWKPCIHANVGYSYRKVVDKYYDLTVDDSFPHKKAISDFGFRGMSCLEEATKASAAWLLSFSGTATIPAIPYLEEMYNCDCTQEEVGFSAVSTEHSVMTANFAVDGNEIDFVKKLLTEIYPNSNFSMVSDSYDYWNMIDNILPLCKKEIMEHNGKLLVRPDSGDIVDISVQTIQHLWDIFSGTINSKGYKVLDSHIGCIYGDGVTQERADIIYKKLMESGFASNNIIFGAGSFSFNAIMEDSILKPYTRDTFSVAIKATYGEINNEPIMIFKDPKTDRETGEGFKKSQKGMCFVHRNADGDIVFEDGYTSNTICKIGNLLTTVFLNGTIVKEQTLSEIRDVLHGGKF